MFYRDQFLERNFYLFDKSECNYCAYTNTTVGDNGFVILIYPDYTELFEFFDGPYVFIQKCTTFDEAIEILNELN